MTSLWQRRAHTTSFIPRRHHDQNNNGQYGSCDPAARFLLCLSGVYPHYLQNLSVHREVNVKPCKAHTVTPFGIVLI